MKSSNSRLVLLPGVAKLSVMQAIIYSVRVTGTRLVSIVRSREVSAIQGLPMYMEKHSGHLCLLCHRCPQLRGVR